MVTLDHARIASDRREIGGGQQGLSASSRSAGHQVTSPPANG
jgi:hypothetical protein